MYSSSGQMILHLSRAVCNTKRVFIDRLNQNVCRLGRTVLAFGLFSPYLIKPNYLGNTL